MEELAGEGTGHTRAVRSPHESEACREIGFNQQVRVGARSLHVQTEVTGRDELSVRSTVLEGGVVCYAHNQVLGAEYQGVVAVRRAAERQHKTVVDRVARGELA